MHLIDASHFLLHLSSTLDQNVKARKVHINQCIDFLDPLGNLGFQLGNIWFINDSKLANTAHVHNLDFISDARMSTGMKTLESVLAYVDLSRL